MNLANHLTFVQGESELVDMRFGLVKEIKNLLSKIKQQSLAEAKSQRHIVIKPTLQTPSKKRINISLDWDHCQARMERSCP